MRCHTDCFVSSSKARQAMRNATNTKPKYLSPSDSLIRSWCLCAYYCLLLVTTGDREEFENTIHKFVCGFVRYTRVQDEFGKSLHSERRILQGLQ